MCVSKQQESKRVWFVSSELQSAMVFILSVSLSAPTRGGWSASFPRFSAIYLREKQAVIAPRTMKCRRTATTCRMSTMIRIALVGIAVVHASPTEPLPSTLLNGIGNVANSATNFRKSDRLNYVDFCYREITRRAKVLYIPAGNNGKYFSRIITVRYNANTANRKVGV